MGISQADTAHNAANRQKAVTRLQELLQRTDFQSMDFKAFDKAVAEAGKYDAYY